MEEHPISIREGGPGDAARIARFNMAMAEETEGIRLDPETVLAGVRAVLEDPGKGRYYLAERRGEIAGQLLVTYEWSDWRNATFLWIQSLHVQPRHRRAGVFRALFRHVRALAASPGHCGVRLYVHRRNGRAREAYARLGLVWPGYIVLESPDRLRASGGGTRVDGSCAPG